jgi:AcrR family transcriptional regulator
MTDTTRLSIEDATVASLRELGFAGTTTRAIARKGGFNQALIHYYYGSLDHLLIAVMERVSAERIAAYRERMAGVTVPGQLLGAASELYRVDRESGHTLVMGQLVAGALTRATLAEPVRACMDEWVGFARETLDRVVDGLGFEGVPTDELARSVVVYYLGANLLTAIEPGDTGPERLLEFLAGVLGSS